MLSAARARGHAAEWQAVQSGLVPFPVPPDPAAPIIDAAARQPPSATAVTVPKAAVHKHYAPALPENDVRLSREIAGLKPVTIAETVKHSSHLHFRRRVPPPHRTHIGASRLGSEMVRHLTPKQLRTPDIPAARAALAARIPASPNSDSGPPGRPASLPAKPPRRRRTAD